MNSNDISKVINRKGQEIDLDYNKILNRLTSLINMKPKLNILPHRITIKTIEGIYDKIHTYELDELSSKICGSLITNNLDYSKLASRIEISRLHKETDDCFIKTIINANSYKNSNGDNILLINEKLIKFAKYYKDIINNTIDYSRDYNFEYFGILTLKKSYLLKQINPSRNIIIERPQHLYMRVALGIHLCYIDDNGKLNDDFTIEEVMNTYDLLSQGYYSHATPTLFNAGTNTSSLSSCFLLNLEDNLNHIYKTLTDTAKISKWSGGIGICSTNIRARGSLINGTNGVSDGIVPMLKVFNDSACYVNQGGGKRKGSTAVYLEPWHSDISEFLDLKKPIGDEMLRARDLFLALWIPDIFMERLIESTKTNDKIMWSLFCPNECKLLTTTYGDNFTVEYLKYENMKRYKKQVNIQDLWRHILEIQMESGMPYIMYKDNVNRKCNQNNLGIIKSSNLCVSGDTKILTKNGYEEIGYLEKTYVDIWDGEKFTESPVDKTGEGQKLLKISTSDGCELKCTKYHRFKIVNNYNKVSIIQADNLKPGDKLLPIEFPVINGNDSISHAYTSGLYNAVGENSCNTYSITLTGERMKLLKYINYSRVLNINNTSGYIKLGLYNNKNITIVPLNASLLDKLTWLGGFLDGAANILTSKNNTQSLLVESTVRDILYNVKLLSNTIGINTHLSYDNTCKLYKLYFDENETHFLYNELCIKTNLLKYNFNIPIYERREEVFIKSIEDLDGLHDTYCFNSGNNHMGVFNGMYSMNCSEITIYTDEYNTGVCNLASLTLPKYVSYDNNIPYFDYQKLYENTKIVTYNLNKVIDNNFYPTNEGNHSDKSNRPIGIGVSGLADVFIMFRCSYTSDKAKELNKKIFETMYFATMESSNELAIKFNKSYINFNTSMLSDGVFQFDLWKTKPIFDKWDWEGLRKKIKLYGSYNSMNIALMPTASTASILGTSENFEPITSNMYLRRVLSGSFQIVNKYLIQDLIDLGIWGDNIKQKIIANDGSIQGINEIPKNIQEIYKISWEYKIKDLIDMDRDRGAYVCQSSSSNRFMQEPNTNKLTSMHVYAWKQGLKTSSYYLRTRTIANAIKFNVDVDIIKEMQKNKQKSNIINDEEECLMCTV